MGTAEIIMGRKPSTNKNLPPHMRKRVQRSGKAYYYLDTGKSPRKEIALGDDFILALRKYTELHQVAPTTASILFGSVIDKYMAERLPDLSANTQKTHSSDMKHLRAFFATAPLDQIKPRHIQLFIEKHTDKPTTANRCKRLFSTLWNNARGWGYTDLENPCTGIIGLSIQRRTEYITDAVFKAVRDCASAPLQDAIDLAYLTGQRPADALKMCSSDLIDGMLVLSQGKTKKRLRIAVTGELAELLGKIVVRKAQHKIVHAQLLMNRDGKPMTQPALRSHFDRARLKAIDRHPKLAEQIKNFRFYDLRAKAADDTSDNRGEQAASDLLGHDNVKTTQRHYLRRGKIVAPTR